MVLLALAGGAAKRQMDQKDAQDKARRELEVRSAMAEINLGNSKKLALYSDGISRRREADRKEAELKAFYEIVGVEKAKTAPYKLSGSPKAAGPQGSTPAPSETSVVESPDAVFDRPQNYGVPGFEAYAHLGRDGAIAWKAAKKTAELATVEYNKLNKNIQSQYGTGGLEDYHRQGYTSIKDFEDARGSYWDINETIGSVAAEDWEEANRRGVSITEWNEDKGQFYMSVSKAAVAKVLQREAPLSDIMPEAIASTSNIGDINKAFKEADFRLTDTTGTPGAFDFQASMFGEAGGATAIGNRALHSITTSAILSQQSQGVTSFDESIQSGMAAAGTLQSMMQDQADTGPMNEYIGGARDTSQDTGLTDDEIQVSVDTKIAQQTARWNNLLDMGKTALGNADAFASFKRGASQLMSTQKANSLFLQVKATKVADILNTANYNTNEALAEFAADLATNDEFTTKEKNFILGQIEGRMEVIAAAEAVQAGEQSGYLPKDIHVDPATPEVLTPEAEVRANLDARKAEIKAAEPELTKEEAALSLGEAIQAIDEADRAAAVESVAQELFDMPAAELVKILAEDKLDPAVDLRMTIKFAEALKELQNNNKG